MKRVLFLSGAMAIALSAVPAVAELPSSPAELAQTRSLNEGGRGGTYASPQTLNGERTRSAEAKPSLNPDDFVPLKTIDPDRLEGNSVENGWGIVLGRVIDVTLARDGTPAELAIELVDGRRVRVSEAALRYNPNDRTLLTNVDVGQLRSIASADDNGQ
jgi:hypothetical protein